MRISNMIRKYVPFNSFRVSGHVVYLKISQSRYMCIANKEPPTIIMYYCSLVAKNNNINIKFN